ncbi:MAG: VOC family protein [Acidimicrobiia bacterium]|nr:VOC family protein [Acidimicrobiia bacterium]MDH3470393.1 VOC family protein [Acidimicrobiia bacterium]
MSMLGNAKMFATLSASDLGRAKAWYAEKLDLKPVEEREQALWYETGSTRWLLYQSSFAGTNQATSAGFQVEDVEATVAEMRGRGVEFQEYDFPDFKTVDGVATTPDGAKAAWFTDSEGNIVSIATP